MIKKKYFVLGLILLFLIILFLFLIYKEAGSYCKENPIVDGFYSCKNDCLNNNTDSDEYYICFDNCRDAFGIRNVGQAMALDCCKHKNFILRYLCSKHAHKIN
jgi:hypothetical protein